MADGDTEMNRSEQEYAQTNDEGGDKNEPIELSGWLMKRSRHSHKWKKQWFHLIRTDLFYGDSEKDTTKKISLVASEIAETNIDEKNNAFRIRPSDSKRVYYMYADDENTQHNWMQAICFAKAAGHTGDESQACNLQ